MTTLAPAADRDTDRPRSLFTPAEAALLEELAAARGLPPEPLPLP